MDDDPLGVRAPDVQGAPAGDDELPAPVAVGGDGTGHRSRVRATGVWRARFGVSSGVDRAHAPASHGFAGGVSPRLTVIVR